MSTSNPETSSPEAPHWPAEPIDPRLAWVDYDVRADELLVYFGGKPVPAISSSLDGAGFGDVAVMIGLDADDEETGQIVGVQVIPMLLGAVQKQPAWVALAWAAMAGDLGAELLQERLPIFLAEVADAFDRYWTPAPPLAEQLARLVQSGSVDGPRTAKTA